MKTGAKPSLPWTAPGASLDSARQLLLQWIVANEVKRRAASDVGLRYAAGLALVPERTKS